MSAQNNVLKAVSAQNNVLKAVSAQNNVLKAVSAQNNVLKAVSAQNNVLKAVSALNNVHDDILHTLACPFDTTKNLVCVTSYFVNMGIPWQLATSK